jgi:glycosyltransferase involved in cell wall biosynthesis
MPDTLQISLVVPVFHNSASLVELHRRLAAAMAASKVERWDITYVDDGSGDDSYSVLLSIQRDNPGVRVLRLSRNFGSMAAIQAGLSHARGAAVVVISADLQDPPEMLEQLIERWRAGAKVVLAARESRQDPLASRFFSALFYRLFRAMVSSDMPHSGFDFFLLDAQVARLLVEHAEKNTNLAAAILWLGFRREVVPYHRAARAHGRSMWTFASKLKYLYDSLLSFSYVPLRVMTLFGLLGVLTSFGYGAAVAVERFADPAAPRGWASLMVANLFFSGLMLASIGTVGEYVWRAFDAARARPAFIVEECREPARELPLSPAGSAR